MRSITRKTIFCAGGVIAACLSLFGGWVIYSVQNAEREATITVVTKYADSNGVGFIDSSIPHIVDRLRARGMSQQEICSKLIQLFSWPDGKERVAAALALKLDDEADLRR